MMQIFATFEHSSYLELALSALETQGFGKDRIVAVPLELPPEERTLFDSLHRADGVSLIDLGMALATAFAVVGASVGFVLAWGPITWGLIGAVAGFLAGFGIKFLYLKLAKSVRRPLKGKHAEVVLVVECDMHSAERVERILWSHFALGTARYEYK